MKYIKLSGDSISEDVKTIQRELGSESSAVFVYIGAGTLYDYIDALYDKGNGLDADYLYRFRVCYENRSLNITYSMEDGSDRRTITAMSDLIQMLDNGRPCRIVIENNDRVQHAFIAQQLIYIQYPLETVNILLRKEEQDADKSKRFMKNVNELLEGCQSAIQRLNEIKASMETEADCDNPTRIECLNDIAGALNTCQKIQSQIEKSISVELKLAVAASKKAGKSVIVNCFLGEQIAPTSTELATPNNCIYRKSRDRQYHLCLDGGKSEGFSARNEIYDAVNGYFRAAQNNREGGFALPDMTIDYVTDENNFSSYTIYDTAGPDAAGTTHEAVAERAMKECDVAVFAIDYSKYLTTSEEQYLGWVKDTFTRQNKFHSLIFALNKIDVRYTDVESPKSFVMSVDFLKTRLANIDETYRDCIVFPTCSLEYASAVEAEKAGVTEMLDGQPITCTELGSLKKKYRKDVPALAWLHTHAENLEYYHNIENFSIDVFKKDSGMPALMNYVSYIAQSKAREEIVNNVTFEIAAQKMKLQAILDFVANIEALINAEDEKIQKITEILNDYKAQVQRITSRDVQQEELDTLKRDSLLRQCHGSFKTFADDQEKAVLENGNLKKELSEGIFVKAVEKIWGKIDESGSMDAYQIDALLTSADVEKIANEVAKTFVDDAAEKTDKQMNRLRDEVKSIADQRQEKLCTVSESCRKLLESENVTIGFPDKTDFAFALTMPNPQTFKVSEFKLNINLSDTFESLFHKELGSSLLVFIKSIFGRGNEKDTKRRLKAKREEFENICETNLKPSFKNAVYESDIEKKVTDSLTETVVEGYLRKFVDNLQEEFDSMNNSYFEFIEYFSKAIDTRDFYKENIDCHLLRKHTIEAIQRATDGFMQVWNVIIRDITESEFPGNSVESDNN